MLLSTIQNDFALVMRALRFAALISSKRFFERMTAQRLTRLRFCAEKGKPQSVSDQESEDGDVLSFKEQARRKVLRENLQLADCRVADCLAIQN
ncbi:hypothetical protein JHW43_009380 [Diplocarpon mali]|nr:hypothetical protein JHW43_009380 [Diplocarpon mali]